MINSATKYQISEIFNIDFNVQYIIPKFQREYTWGKEECEELINDIWENEENHYIGSIICINRGIEAHHPILEIIDGQQRLTTISLLFCAIYKLLSEKIDDEDQKLELLNLKNRIIQKKNPNALKLELSEQNSNFQDYKSILNEIGIITYTEENKNKGNRMIYKTYRYYLSYLDNFKAGNLLTLLDKIINTLLVKIEVNTHSDAFMLFESLNNRGIPLSAIDLIKNKMLSELDKNNVMDIDAAFEKWKKIIYALPEYTIQERFLRQYYNAYKHNPDIKVEKATKATKTNLIKIFEALITRNTAFIFDELIEKSAIYSKLLLNDNNIEDIFLDIKPSLIDLLNVKATPSYTLLLYLLSKHDNTDREFFDKIVNFLVKYFIRRNLTDYPNTRNMDQIFIDLIEEINSDDTKNTAEYIINYLTSKDRISSLETFKERLNSDIYLLNIDATRFILSKIEEKKGTREIFKDFWAKDKSNKLIWTIEHILPEGKNIPKEWVQMIAEGDKEKAHEIQQEYVHKIGNLTLTGYNSNLSNMSFEKKRDRKSDNNYIGYKNGLFLNENIHSLPKWDKENIKKRTEKLVNQAVLIFKFDHE